MPFKRFIIWLFERLFELQLAVGAVLLVKFFLPLSPDSYAGLDAFAAGVRDTWRTSLDDAAYVTSSFLQGSYLRFAGKTYLAAAYLVVHYGYIASLYLFTSLLAALLGPRHHVRNALLAYICSILVFFLQFVRTYDSNIVHMSLAFVLLGTLIVALMAFAGEAAYRSLGGKTPQQQRSVRGRVRLDLGS